MQTQGTEHSDLISYRIRSGASAEGGFVGRLPEAGVAVEDQIVSRMPSDLYHGSPDSGELQCQPRVLNTAI